MPSGTWEDGPDGGAAAKQQWLVHVLSFEDLLAADTAPFAIGDASFPFTIRRAEEGKKLGRLGKGALAIPDRWLSSEHAVIERRGTSFVLRDAGSRNGTFVDGARITEHALSDGDLIEVGHRLLVFRELEASLADAVSRRREPITIGPTRTLNPAMISLRFDLERIAPSRDPVLIIGETGTGKELLAAEVHALSGRTGALRAIDCGAIPDGLFESTFFGHEKGAFTGAESRRAGELVLANGGTLFLDEVGNLSPTAQAKLLRVLEEGRVRPLGASDPVAVDVRLVAATNRELGSADPGMRVDLVRRLAGYVARPVPLRRRREDLGFLCAHLLRDLGVLRASITPPAARKLLASPLPGNIRELRATLRTAALLAGESPIDVPHVRGLDTPAEEASPSPPSRRGRPDKPTIEAALTATNGNVVQTAKRLGTHPRQLYRWLEELEIDIEPFR